MSNRETKSTTLDELKKICDAATKGPWYPTMIRRMNGESHTVDDDEQSICKVLSEKPVDDKYFIATARTEMPKLIVALKSSEERIQQLSERSEQLDAALKIARRNIHHGELRHELAGDDDFSAFVEHCPACAALKEIDALLSEGTKVEDK